MREWANRLGIKIGSASDAQSVTLLVAEGFLFVTAILSLGVFPEEDRLNNIVICVFVSALLVMPWVFERALGVEMPTMLKGFLILLMLGGPVLGKIYKFYYRISHWDKLLHISSGFLFAIIGSLFPQLTDKRNKEHSLTLTVTYAFFFTLSVAVVWEFFEYAMDRFLNMDMQQDTWIPSVNSYLLGTEKGVIGRIPQISSVVVNGQEIAVDGYLDIGLVDTMNDMLVCTIGGIIYCVFSVLYAHRIKAVAWFKNLMPTIAPENGFAIPSDEFVSAGVNPMQCEKDD